MTTRKVLWVCLCAIPLLVFYALLERQALPVPMYDDYSAILSFGLHFQHLAGLGAKLLYIVSAQQNEYKLIFEHAIVAADIAATGSIHFGCLIWLGNSLILPILLLLWMNAFDSRTPERIPLFAPVCFLVAQLNYAENLDWAMCGLQTFPVILFSLASIHFLVRKRAIAASSSACLAIFSSGNGFFLIPIGMLVFIRDRDWRRLSIWLGFAALSLTCYAYGYTPHRYPSAQAGLLKTVLFLASFVGAAVENMHHRPVPYGAVILGLGVLAIYVQNCRYKLYDSNPFLFYMVLWCLLSGAAVEYGRMWAGFTASLIPRYKVYSDLLLMFSYVAVMTSLKGVSPTLCARKRAAYSMMLAVSVLLALSGDYAGYNFIAKRRSIVQEGLDRYKQERNLHLPSIPNEAFGGAEPEYDKRLLDQTSATGLLKLPSEL